MERKTKKPKDRRRNMERRKEKSRDAARCRRGKESQIFDDLMAQIPLEGDLKRHHLDKASVIRLIIAYLKTRNVAQFLAEPPVMSNLMKKPKALTQDVDSLALDALEGFTLIVSIDGDIVYISHNVHQYLGLNQIDLIGQNVYDLNHPCDHDELKEMLSTRNINSHRLSYLRTKCTINNKGRNIHSKSTNYKVIRYGGRIVESSTTESHRTHFFIGCGMVIAHPASIERPLGLNTFLTKHSLDMKFVYADERMADFFGFNPTELVAKSLFDFHHTEDSFAISKAFKILFQRGQIQIDLYRFLAHGGGFGWVATDATIVYNQEKPHSVICVNYMLSEIEEPDQIFSLYQLENGVKPTCIDSCDSNNNNHNNNNKRTIEKSTSKPLLIVKNLGIRSQPSPPPFIFGLTSSAAAAAAAAAEPINTSEPIITPSINKPPTNSEPTLPQTPPSPSPTVPLTYPLSPYSSPSQSSNFFCSIPDNEYWLVNDNQDDGVAFTAVEPQNLTNVDDSQLSSTQSVFVELKDTVESPLSSTQSVFVELKDTGEAPKHATTEVFKPRTEDMNKGFLSFGDDESELTMLKEEPDDLTHLAPIAGDICVPLDESTSNYVLPGMMLDEIIFADCPLFTDEDSHSPKSMFNGRDDDSPDRPLSPILDQNDDYSIPSLSSDDSLQESIMNHFLDFGLIDDMESLSGKSSFIPLNFEDDPLLPFVTNDFMWHTPSSGESSAWSSIPSSPTSDCSLSPRVDHKSSLAELLKADTICNYDDGGGGIYKPKASQYDQVNSLADRNYNIYSRPASYKRGQTIGGTMKRRYSKKNGNNCADEKKRGLTANGKRGADGEGSSLRTKRMKQTTRTIIINGANGGGGGGGTAGGRKVPDGAAASQAANQQQTNSVLMNLLVSGCDLNAGYDDDRLQDAGGGKRMSLPVKGHMKDVAERENLIRVQLKRKPPCEAKRIVDGNRRPSLSDGEPDQKRIPSLIELTEQDFAVNAPNIGELLQGSELLDALDNPLII